MIEDLIFQNQIIQNQNFGFEFLQGSIPVVLSLALILMIADAILEAKSHNKFKSQR